MRAVPLEWNGCGCKRHDGGASLDRCVGFTGETGSCLGRANARGQETVVIDDCTLMNRPDTMQRFYARLVTALGSEPERRLVDAFAKVPRELFVGPGPWQIPVHGGYMDSETDDPAILYQDINIALAPEPGINNGQPSLHAHCIKAIAPEPGEVVVHVGAGTGYYTAILAELVGDTGRVHAYEVNHDLCSRAQENLAHYAPVTVYAVSALEAALPTADVIYVSAGTTHVPCSWLDALSTAGRLFVPLTPDEGPGFMLFVARRTKSEYDAQSLSPAFFIGCTGAREQRYSKLLATAIKSRSPGEIRSFRRGSDPDDTAWCVWPDSWLSTAPIAPAAGDCS
jgi:protein-L-isoaspartate(D-aspartate) O-methyltransferase